MLKQAEAVSEMTSERAPACIIQTVDLLKRQIVTEQYLHFMMENVILRNKIC